MYACFWTFGLGFLLVPSLVRLPGSAHLPVFQLILDLKYRTYFLDFGALFSLCLDPPCCYNKYTYRSNPANVFAEVKL